MSQIPPRPRRSRRAPHYPALASLALGVAACAGLVDDPGANAGDDSAGQRQPQVAGGLTAPWVPTAGTTNTAGASSGGLFTRGFDRNAFTAEVP